MIRYLVEIKKWVTELKAFKLTKISRNNSAYTNALDTLSLVDHVDMKRTTPVLIIMEPSIEEKEANQKNTITKVQEKSWISPM